MPAGLPGAPIARLSALCDRRRGARDGRMRQDDPVWEQERRKNFAHCSPRKVKTALSAAGISEYDLIQDDSGFWICFTR